MSPATRKAVSPGPPCPRPCSGCGRIVVTSGDVVVLGGAARRCYHGVDRIYPGTSTLLPPEHFPGGGRINLTLRRVKLA